MSVLKNREMDSQSIHQLMSDCVVNRISFLKSRARIREKTITTTRDVSSSRCIFETRIAYVNQGPCWWSSGHAVNFDDKFIPCVIGRDDP